MEYLIGLRMRRRRRAMLKVKGTIEKPIASALLITERECLDYLHLPPCVVIDICHILSRNLAAKTTFPLPMRVTTALHFFATGSLHCPLRSTKGLAPTTAISFIASVTQELVRHAAEFIIFPSSPESQAKVKKEFKRKFKAPNILGIIDCTHVVMRAPTENSNAYFNNEGSYSINIQIICDALCKITHVLTHFPASTPDATILEQSEIPTVFENDSPLDGVLLGDSAYPLKPWLMTPFSEPKTKPELSFNIMHLDAFETMNQTVTMLKRRFRCLDKPSGQLQYAPHKVGMFFVACCVLHNIAMRHGYQVEIDEDTVKNIRRLDNVMQVPLAKKERDSVALERRAELAHELCDG